MGSSFATNSRDRASGYDLGHPNSPHSVLSDAFCTKLSCKRNTVDSLHPIEADRVRERQHFLLARLVGTIVSGCSEKIASQLLERFGSLSGIFAASQISLARHTDSAALATLLIFAKAAVVEGMRDDVRRVSFDPRDSQTMNYLIATMQGEAEEHLHAIFLDSQRRYLKDERVASGGWSHITIMLRPLLRRALELNSAQLVLFHNHPSGVAKPSQADIAFTQQASSVANLLGIELFDHLIVAGPSVFSMRSAGMMP